MKRYFRSQTVVEKIENTTYTPSKLQRLIHTHHPTEIWHSQWSQTTPFIIITEYNNKGFMMICNGWAEKTPKQYDYHKLHTFLRYQGIDDCYIVTDQDDFYMYSDKNNKEVSMQNVILDVILMKRKIVIERSDVYDHVRIAITDDKTTTEVEQYIKADHHLDEKLAQYIQYCNLRLTKKLFRSEVVNNGKSN